MPTHPPSERSSEDLPENSPNYSPAGLPDDSSASPSLPPNEPNEALEPERDCSFPWFWLGMFVGSVFSAVGLGLAAWGWLYVQDDLSAQISKTLTNYLERPVDLGDVEDVTFGSVTLGPSVISKSATDSTTLTADSVVVEFDLVETLLKSKVGIDITVVDPAGYLAQDPEKGWLNVDIPEQEDPEEPNRFEISVDDVWFRGGDLTLVPLPPENKTPEPIFLKDVRGSLNTEKVAVGDKTPLNFRFEVIGEPVDGGEMTLKGEVQPVEAISAAGTTPTDQGNSENGAAPAKKTKIDWATNLFVQADEAPLADVLRFTLSSINLATNEVAIDSGVVSGTMDMAFRPGEEIGYSGTISAEDATIETALLPLPIENAAGKTQFQGNLWTVNRISGDYGAIEDIVAKGLIDFDNSYELKAVRSNVSVAAFTDTIDLELPVPTAGVFDAIAFVSGPIASPEFSGTVTAVTAVDVDQVTFDSAASNFLLQGTQLYLDDIVATPTTGGAITGNGQVSLTAGSPFTFQLAGRSLPARQLANLYDINPTFTLGLVTADATVVGSDRTVTTTVDWDAPQAQYPGSGTIDINNGLDLTFRDTVFALGGGSASGTGRLIGDLWDADVAFQNVQLNSFSEDLRGDINGQFQFSGTTADTRIDAIAAQGNITFSEGLAAFSPQFDNFNSPLVAQVAWNGENIEVIRASSNRVTASGLLTPSFDDGFTGLDSFDLNVAADDYALAELPFDIPDIMTLAGSGDVGGRLTGSPAAPIFVGNVQLSDLVVNNLPFNSFLAGTVAYSPIAGLALDVDGSTDSIALNVGAADPNSDAIPAFDFNVGWRGAFAQGQTAGNILTGSASNFPLAALNFPTGGAADIGQLRGTLSSSSFTADLVNQTLNGDVAIDQLGVGYIGAGRLTGQINYANSLATLANGTLAVNENLYTLTGSLALDGPAPVYTASLNTQKGNVQNLLTTLSIYRLDDFRRGLSVPDWLKDPISPEDLDTLLAAANAGETAAGRSYNLDEQLNRLAEIEELEVDTAIAEAAEPLPPLRELNGPFAGNIQLNGTGGDFQVDFDLTGQQWRWGEDYSAQEVIAKGTLTPNVLTLAPVRFASDILVPVVTALEAAEPTNNVDVDAAIADFEDSPDALADSSLEADTSVQTVEAAVNLAGQIVFGQDTELTSDLQATAQNINITTFSDIFQIPIDIDGRANGLATLGGTLANPQVRGSAALEAAAINDTPIESAQAGFLYRNARLILSSTLTASTPEEPLRLDAQIPYAFNFMDVKPDTEDIAIDINVRNEGLALLNIFSRQAAWQSGEGQVNLSVGGTLSDPEIAGSATINEAVISAAVLPEPLTNVNGSATFINDQIIVEALQGQFSDGQLTAAGIFPLRRSILSGVELAALSQTPSLSFAESILAAEPPAAADSPLSAEPLALTEAIAPDPATPDSNTSTSTTSDSNTSDTDSPATPTNPLFPRTLAANLPLTVNLENIDLTLQDLYGGSVNGQVVVGGSALGEGPQIGGQVLLSEGQVLLSSGNDPEEDSEAPLVVDSADEAIGTTVADLRRASVNAAAETTGVQPIFRNLQLTLGDSIRVVQGNLLNFVADGTLQINGPPTKLKPEGIINLRSGRVSLYTTLFRLRGNNNTAQFTPESGLQNPFLDVALRASVPEIDSAGPVVSTPFAQADVVDNSDIGFESTGSLRTLRVRADVQGPADAIFENLELSSSPPRSQNELIGLIGGGFITALESTVGSLSGNGDDFGGLINLVSSTLLTSVQDFVGEALSLSEFRLFPVTTASRASSENNTGTGLDIGAEIGFDITEDTTLSIIKVLTDSTNPEFGVNYRLTDSLTVRTNTNLDDINQVLLEYEIRF